MTVKELLEVVGPQYVKLITLDGGTPINHVVALSNVDEKLVVVKAWVGEDRRLHLDLKGGDHPIPFLPGTLGHKLNDLIKNQVIILVDEDEEIVCIGEGDASQRRHQLFDYLHRTIHIVNSGVGYELYRV